MKICCFHKEISMIISSPVCILVVFEAMFELQCYFSLNHIKPRSIDLLSLCTPNRDKVQRDGWWKSKRNSVGCKWKCEPGGIFCNFNFDVSLFDFTHSTPQSDCFFCCSLNPSKTHGLFWNGYNSKLMCTSPSPGNFTNTKTTKCDSIEYQIATQKQTAYNKNKRIEATKAEMKISIKHNGNRQKNNKTCQQSANNISRYGKQKEKNQLFQFLVDHIRNVLACLCMYASYVVPQSCPFQFFRQISVCVVFFFFVVFWIHHAMYFLFIFDVRACE